MLTTNARLFSSTCCRCGRTMGRPANWFASKRKTLCAKTTPATLPRAASTKLSASSPRATLQRPAPNDTRMTTEVAVKSLIGVDDAFAWDEGEGDRTRDSWLSDHREYFSNQAYREGFEMSDEIETVFERFEIVWPPDVADGTN